MQIGHPNSSVMAPGATGKPDTPASHSLAVSSPASRQTDFSFSQSADVLTGDSTLSPVTASSVAAPAENRRGADSEADAANDDKSGDEVTKGGNEQDRDAASELTEEELAMIEQLSARDQEVRAHERAHQAVAGSFAGSASYTYQSGPDGKRYAIGGEVPIDASPIPGNPQATIAKMQVVKAAAMAPAEPSSQDRRVAASASQAIFEAQRLLSEQQRSESASGDERKNPVRVKANDGVSSYAEVSQLDPDKSAALVDIAV